MSQKFDGHDVIEKALVEANKGDLDDAPFPMVGDEAREDRGLGNHCDRCRGRADSGCRHS